MTRHELINIGKLMYGVTWQTYMAKNLGVGLSTVKRWANGENKIPADQVSSINNLFILHHKKVENMKNKI